MGTTALLLAGAIATGAQQMPCGGTHDGMNKVHSPSRVTGDWRIGEPVRVAPALPARNRLNVGLDTGLAQDGTKLDRIILLLEPSAEQKAALDTELAAQQTPGSCEFHKWLTAGEFADRFAVSADDAAQVAAWLKSEGFEVAPLPAGRGWIEFSGTAEQVEQAFHAEIHVYDGETGPRDVLNGSISVPEALAPVIHGLSSLDGMRASAAITKPELVTEAVAALAKEASAQGADAITPQIMTKMLHLPETGGQGETIAIPTRSRIYYPDWNAFRASFGLPENLATEISGSWDGSNAGFTADQATAEFTAEWAGAAAPQARILLVPTPGTGATDGVDLGLQLAIDRQLARTVVVSYSACEAALSEAHRALYDALYRQAAAEGISIVAAAGDSGGAACHVAGSEQTVTTGFGVNALASTQWDTAVGAAVTANAGELSGWAPGGTADAAYAGGGGASEQYARPSWQTVTAGKTQGRLLPEIALPTGASDLGNRGLAFCFTGISTHDWNQPDSSSCTLMRSGGSGVAAAIFGGVSALLAEKYGAQGNLAPRLYALRGQSGIFEDVMEGDARLACAAGSPGCDATGRLGYAAGAGYDLATGLGSVNAEALVKAWPQASGTGATEIVLIFSPTQTNDTYNPSAQITFTATVASGTGGAAPTGTVTFTDSTNGTALTGSPVNLNGSGVATLAVSNAVSGGMAVGGNNIVAGYSGDNTYAAKNSQPVVVTLEPSTTTLTVTPSSTTPAAGVSFTVSVALTVGNPPAGTASPSGLVTLNLDGKAVGATQLTAAGGKISASFTVTAPSTGQHQLQAVYAGDTNYSASTSDAVTVNVGKGATVITLTASPTTLAPGMPEAFTAVLAPAAGSTGNDNITGTVSFYDGATLLGSADVKSYAATLSSVMLDTSKSHLITAVYSGDDNWAPVTSSPLSLVAALLADTVTLTATPAAAGPGQAVSFTVTVTPTKTPDPTYEQNPTGLVTFYSGTGSTLTAIGTATLAISVGNSSTATLTTATLPPGVNTITAVYAGDSYYAPGTSNAATVTVQDFTIVVTSPTGGNLTIVKGASGTATVTVSGFGGYNSQIQLTCSVPGSEYMTCTPSPQQVTPTGTATFTVQTFATGGPSTSVAANPLLRAAGGAALALLAMFIPVGRRARRWIAMVVLLAGLCGAGLGCNSASGNSTADTGTPLGTTTLTITATAYVNQTVVSHAVYLTVNVVPAASSAKAQ